MARASAQLARAETLFGFQPKSEWLLAEKSTFFGPQLVVIRSSTPLRFTMFL
jgi:hypothetical protein